MNRSDERKLFRKMYRFSAEIRWLHWLRALLIFAMLATGFYLGKPFLSPDPSLEPVNFQNALVRFWHVSLGFGLAFATIMRIFLFFFDRYSSRHERESFRDLTSTSAWKAQIKHYLLIGSFHPRGAYGPLQLVSYLTLMALLVCQIVTGLILHSANYHQGLGALFGSLLGPVSLLLGGLTGVSHLHYIIMWALIIFIPIHLYMVYWMSNRYPGKTAEAMFSGYGFQR